MKKLLVLINILITKSSFGLAFLHSGNPDFNTVLPTNNYQGIFNYVLGTAINSNQFLTSKHIGGAVGDLFYYKGLGYETIGNRGLTNSDLIIWEINGNLEDWAEIYEGETKNKEIIIFGRGAARSKPIYSNLFPILYNNRVLFLKGWNIGNYDGKTRWGVNKVIDIWNFPSLGEVLIIDFSLSDNVNWATLTPGDSGGGVFIKENGVLKLVGICYATENFSLALFDQRGIIIGKLGNDILPCKSYISRAKKEILWPQ